MAPEWVITAAHSVKIKTNKELYVTVGDYLRNESAVNPCRVAAAVMEIVRHPEFNSITLDNDIALLRLSEVMQYTLGVAPVCLPCGLS